jgi:putative ABC transport system permease protein
MRILHRISGVIRSLAGRGPVQREVDEEIDSYFDMLVQENMDRGMDRYQAERRAQLDMDGVEQVKESVRAARPGLWLATFAQDIRLSIRRLRREPTLAAAVALTLSIGIGASTAVFGIMSATTLSRIPYEEPERLVVGQTTRNGAGAGFVSGLDYFDYRESSHSFDSLAAFLAFPIPMTVNGNGDPWVAEAGYVSWDLFRTLRVDPILGRHFLAEEEGAPNAQTTIISYGLWQSRFGGVPDVLGRRLVLNGSPCTIVGVMPRGFRFLWDANVWRVVARPGETRNRHNYHLVGRLKQDISLAQAQVDIDAISGALERAYPDSNKAKGLRLISLPQYLGGDVRAALLLPSAATACLLLIACTNAAGLLLARGQSRMAEIAMRSALGASRPRLIRQMLTESVTLTLPAGLLGIGTAYLLQRLLLRLLPADRLGISQPVIDGPVLLFALLISVATGLLVGIVPALRSAARVPLPHLGTGRQVCERGHAARLRGALVAAQIATSVVLLIGAGLVARSLLFLSAADLGFSPGRVFTARMEIQAADYPERSRRQLFFASVLREIRALPGVRSAAAIDNLPILDPGNIWRTRAGDRPRLEEEQAERVLARRVSSGYFATMNMPLRSGRDISDADREGAPAVAVLSESLARKLYPDSDPLGRTVMFINTLTSEEFPHQIVGVVRDARLADPRVSGDPAMYMPILQSGPTRLRIAVRTSGEPEGLAKPIREIVRRADRNALLTGVLTMDAVVDEALSSFRMIARYLGLVAGISLLLAAIGLYGALAYHVSLQEHEIGVRMAMGSTRAGIVGLVLRRGAWIVATGLILGLAGAYPGTILVHDLLFETVPLDPATYTGAVLLLGLVAAAACLVPAARAMRVDPAIVLRNE